MRIELFNLRAQASNVATSLFLAVTLTACGTQIKPVHYSDQGSEVSNTALDRASIIGGVEVLPEEIFAHSTIALYMPKEAPAQGIANFCTGTLIAKNIILTAAHCFKDVAEQYLRIPVEEFYPKVLVGFGLELVQREDDQRVTFRKIKNILIHPGYEVGMVRRATRVPMPDLAILLLDNDAPEGFVPMTLGQDPSLIAEGKEITLAGYGVTQPTNRTMPKQLMKVNVTIANPKLTTAQFTYKVTGGKSACFADSGGPAYFETEKGQYVLGGVTSWGDGYCSKMGAYTSVPSFYDFINESVAKLQSPATF